MRVLAFLNHVTFQCPDGTLCKCLLFAYFCMQGGGLYVSRGASATLDSCQIYQNEASPYSNTKNWVVLAF